MPPATTHVASAFEDLLAAHRGIVLKIAASYCHGPEDRADLVPALVEAVKAYASHEQSVFERVTALRTEAMSARSPARLAQIEAQLEHDVGRLLVLKEAYPELKASENFLQLQCDLVDVEDHLQYARRFYNGAVRELNDGVQRFPDVLVARGFGFSEAEFFEAGDAAHVAPTLELGR